MLAISRHCLSVIDQWPVHLTREEETRLAFQAIAIFAVALYSLPISLSAKLIVTGVAAGATLFLLFLSRLHPGIKEVDLDSDLIAPSNRIEKLKKSNSPTVVFCQLLGLAKSHGIELTHITDCTKEAASYFKEIDPLSTFLGSKSIGYGTDKEGRDFIILRVFRKKEAYGHQKVNPIYEIIYSKQSGAFVQVACSMFSALCNVVSLTKDVTENATSGPVYEDTSFNHISGQNIFGESATLEDVYSAFQQLTTGGVFQRKIGRANLFHRTLGATYSLNAPT